MVQGLCLAAVAGQFVLRALLWFLWGQFSSGPPFQQH